MTKNQRLAASTLVFHYFKLIYAPKISKCIFFFFKAENVNIQNLGLHLFLENVMHSLQTPVQYSQRGSGRTAFT